MKFLKLNQNALMTKTKTFIKTMNKINKMNNKFIKFNGKIVIS